jgi:hypothetical protein
MKIFLLGALVVFCSAANSGTTAKLFLEDGYHPLMMEDRISFFIETTFSGSSKFINNTVTISVVTVSCKTGRGKETVTHIKLPGDTVVRALHTPASSVIDKFENYISDISAKFCQKNP